MEQPAQDLLPLYQCQDNSRQLTLDNYVLTGLFVALALTTHLVGKAITLMSEGPTMLTSQDSCHQLILDMEDQKLPNSKENKKKYSL